MVGDLGVERDHEQPVRWETRGVEHESLAANGHDIAFVLESFELLSELLAYSISCIYSRCMFCFPAYEFQTTFSSHHLNNISCFPGLQ